MSDEVGGYYAELKLLTDASSFAQGRKQLEDFSKAGERAVAIFTALQRVTGGIGGTGNRFGGVDGGPRWVGGGPGSFAQQQIGYTGGVQAYQGGVVRTSDFIGGEAGQKWRYAGNNFGQGGSGGMKPPFNSGYMRDEGGEESEDKGEAKKGALTE